MRTLRIGLFFLAVALTGGFARQPVAAESGAAQTFSFAVIGDAPYNARQEPLVKKLIEEINGEELAFVVHIGDFKSGSSRCSDELFKGRKEMFQASRHPFIFIPGDNEWTDCHRIAAGGYDPLERLAMLRELFFQGDGSLGQRELKLSRQSDDSRYAKYRENVRWVYGNVLFAGFNIPGSNNNFGRNPEADAEYHERNAANRAWLTQAFELARRQGLQAIVLFMHGNLFDPHPAVGTLTGYVNFSTLLTQQTLAFGKPVLLVHGDTHIYRSDQPLLNPASGAKIENFNRLESFGSPHIGWVRVSADRKGQFVIEPRRQKPPESD